MSDIKDSPIDSSIDSSIDVPLEPPVLKRERTIKTDTPTNTPKPKRQANAWVTHVKAVATEKGISYKQALSIARDTYTR